MDVESDESYASLDSHPTFDLPMHTHSSHLQNGTIHSPQAERPLCCGGEDLKRPLTLLTLPIDVLREIVKEVTHTNDLTALALTHSALHSLAVPHIYSRFDIVWPDSTSSSDAKSGVDALTYGLSTLVMSNEAFQTPETEGDQTELCPHCGQHSRSRGRSGDGSAIARRGNDYAKYTKKFSLGNGPSEWVAEYFINKESGKMLGTLAALALARMINLESFVWDMASGIVRDVWDSLAAKSDGRRSRLQSIWVRCHDNKITSPSLVPGSVPPHLLNAPSDPRKSNCAVIESYQRVEHPSFSILPPLKSITVLAIDELAYLEELSHLIEGSSKSLRDLRIGTSKSWPPAKPPEVPMASVHGYMGNDGVLGVLFSKLLAHHGSYLHTDCPIQECKLAEKSQPSPEELGDPEAASVQSPKTAEQVSVKEVPKETQRESGVCLSPTQSTEVEAMLCEIVEHAVTSTEPHPNKSLGHTHTTRFSSSSSLAIESALPVGKLSLDALELERISLGIKVLREAVDWTKLTTLTLLHCNGDEKLWRALQKKFAPQPSVAFGSFSKNTPASLEYRLNLKRIRTNSVSPTLIAVLKETLAPNSLEWLFLHDKEEEGSKVSIDSILKGPIRYHRHSLRKLMIDSSAGTRRVSKARKWMFTRETLSFVTSKMNGIRELAFSVDYKDWHFFLQQLPRIPRLRSLYIPQVIDHIHGNIDTRELASQILDIVFLRPEIELCYMGLGSKCFEIFEATGKNGAFLSPTRANHESDTENEDEDDLDDENESDEDNDDLNDAQEATAAGQDSGEGNDAQSDTSFSDGEDSSKLRLDFREILFYVEKVDIFRARYCTF